MKKPSVISAMGQYSTHVVPCRPMPDIVSDEIIAYLNMTSFLPTGLLSIIGEEHGALVILKDDIICDIEALHLQE